MGADMLAELAHLFLLEACDHRSDREARYLMKCSRALAERAVKATHPRLRSKSPQRPDP